MIGLVVNPIAGMGGAVGLKGTDGQDILQEALRRGAQPNALNRAREYLMSLHPVWTRLQILTAGGTMGGDLARDLGIAFEVIYDPPDREASSPANGLPHTRASDTAHTLESFLTRGVDLVVFVGGDGTARDVFNVVGDRLPCLGIPAGVKIHSSVFAINPTAAANLTMQFLWDGLPTREAEVVDLDEEAFRENRVDARLYGYLRMPFAPSYVQATKMASPSTGDEQHNQRNIARFVIEDLEPGVYYFLGPGTTTRAVAQELGLDKTLLGVDVILDKRLVATDVAEKDLLGYCQQGPCKIIVTAIGQQGFVFGRGNLQYSAPVLEIVGNTNLIIILTRYKLSTLPGGKLRVDTRDPATDEKLRGLYRVIVDYGEYRIIEMQ